jgi:hypothetical protein
MLYAAGAFPKSKSDVKGAQPTPLDGNGKWEIEFDAAARPGANNNPSDISQSPGIRNQDSRYPANEDTLALITYRQAGGLPKGEGIMLEWGTAIGYYKFYAQVYSLLGTVEESQYTVFERLTANFNFFRKSYYLNANTAQCVENPQSCGNDGVFSPGGFNMKKISKDNNTFFMHYIQKIVFYAKVFTGGSIPPFFLGRTTPPMDMTTMSSDGLFQLATIPSGMLDDLGRGLHVYQGWDAPSNYFNVDFNTLAKCKETGRPCVHALVSSQCPQLTSAGNNCVWPNPTPKYQTRLYP